MKDNDTNTNIAIEDDALPPPHIYMPLEKFIEIVCDNSVISDAQQRVLESISTNKEFKIRFQQNRDEYFSLLRMLMDSKQKETILSYWFELFVSSLNDVHGPKRMLTQLKHDIQQEKEPSSVPKQNASPPKQQ